MREPSPARVVADADVLAAVLLCGPDTMHCASTISVGTHGSRLLRVTTC